MDASNSASFRDLPNEILLSILSNFRTTALIKFSTVSQHIHYLILHIIEQRLLEAARLQEHKLLLECFHPASKFSSPPLFCEYLETQPIASKQLEGGNGEDGNGQGMRFADLYSSFLPLKPSGLPKLPRSHPAGGPLPTPTTSNGRVDNDEEFVCQNVNLDSYELFSQLCTVASLVKTHSKRGLFLSSVKISNGIARVWRHWLAEQAPKDEAEILWVDVEKTIGLKMRVVERTDGPTAVAAMRSRNDEDPAVGYTLMLEALVVKTTKLLLMVEQSRDDENKHSGMFHVVTGEQLLTPFSKPEAVHIHGSRAAWTSSMEAFAKRVYGLA